MTKPASLLLLFLLYASYGRSQSVTILGNPPAIQIQTASDVINGKQTDHTSLRVSFSILNLLKHIELYVRAQSSNMTMPGSSSTIPAGNIGISVINPANADPEVFLTTADQRLFRYQIGLIAGLLGGSFNTTVRYRVLGGTNLLKQAGTYSLTITYRFTID